MVFAVGWSVFWLPSFRTPLMIRETFRSAVRGLLPIDVRYMSVALKISPPTFRSQRKLRFQFLYRSELMVPRVKDGLRSPIGRKCLSTIGKPVEGLIRTWPLFFCRELQPGRTLGGRRRS